MGLFSKKNSPDWLDGMMYEYKQLLNDINFTLSYVFKFYDNDGLEYIYKENTDDRSVFLLRNKNRIAIKQVDVNGKEEFIEEVECSLYKTSDVKIVRIIHELYAEKLYNFNENKR